MSDRRRLLSEPRLLYGDPIYPGNGYPPRPGEDRPGLSPFGRLAKGQTLGKSSILVYNHRLDDVQHAPVDMITVEGDDLDSWQLVLTLHPPRVIPLPFHVVQARLDQQNLTGEQTNSEVTVENFPGTTHAVKWPPLEAKLEFGTGGVAATAIVDYTNGVTLTVQASYLRVSALVSQTRKSGDVDGTSAAYYLAAHVGPGFAESHAQRTIFVGVVANQVESYVMEVPKFAKLATLIGTVAGPFGTAPVPTVGWIRFYQSPNGHNPVADFPVTGQTHVEVPNTAQYFNVLNQSGQPMKMAVVYELSL